MDTKDFPRVVAFSANNSKNSSAGEAQARPLPPFVVSVRDTACSWLFARMKEVFAGVDDTLFATAEKVHLQEEQDGLFQALRVLRLERTRITERFVNAVQAGFHEIEKEYRGLEAEESQDSAGLSLVQNDDLEQQVALKSIIAAAKRDFATPIAELSLRLDTLLPTKVYDENMPLSPGVLCRALQRALKPLDIHLRARLILLKKFEQLLGIKLNSLYQNCNQLLIDKGVLPSLKDPLLQRRLGARPATPATPVAPQMGAPAGAPVDGSASAPQSGQAPGLGMPGVGGIPGGAGMTGGYGMPGGVAASGVAAGAAPGMAGAGAHAGGAPAQSGAGGYGLLPPGAGAAPLATPDLLQHLGALQLVPLQSGPVGQVLDVNSLLEQRLVEAKQGASLQELDTEVIRMVDMLFSFMLEDRNLAEPIKVQLIRLQLPLLKLAVADKSFFSKGGHPARKLFNALADAAIGWQPGENFRKEPFYCEICEIVERVLQDFDRDEEIFTGLLQDFEEFVARERRRAQVLERRTVDEAQGNARVEAARARVAAVFDALTAERKLPKVVHEWLNRVWNSVLFGTCLKEGTDSDNWRRAVLTARDLVWSVVAPMPESRFKMQQLLPGLRKRLDEGARSLSLGAGDRQRLMGGLDRLYRERQALGERVESERERRTRERLVQELRREADSIVAIPEVPGISEAEEELARDAIVEPAEVAEMPGVETLELLDQETDLPAVEELQQVAQSAPLEKDHSLSPLAISDEHWQQTYHLKDSWFMLENSGKPPMRCRLAAIIRDLDQFMFVNRAGAKVAVYARLELAHALRDGVMKPLEKGPLFERALQYVVGNIGEIKIAVSVDESKAEEAAAV
ncbi:DUF1631 domain-containing protein [Microbulbifer hainanensis]|uniref:DUF1631 domain-containing protein n=1 Tax=Microbulbifer hainanensis TaxID=2735675 RepID=UPI001867AD0B|nr:DUF1631 domain-containing protein [Microbulbifer hainanensis]